MNAQKRYAVQVCSKLAKPVRVEVLAPDKKTARELAELLFSGTPGWKEKLFWFTGRVESVRKDVPFEHGHICGVW